MSAWWGLAGLAGLPGIFGLVRASARRDPLARYPAAREPAVSNADAAHTPLMTPRITPDMLRHDGGPPGGAAGTVPRARAGDHDRPVPAAGIRPEAPPSAGRLRRPGVPKESPGGRSAVREPLPRRRIARPSPEPDAELVPTQPFAAPSRPDGTLAGELPQAVPERSEEPLPAADRKRNPGRLRDTARQLAASAARTVRDRRGQFTRILRKGKSR
ncbi:hypothetical protein ACWEHA_07360 [Amycolatopsis nivea]